MGISKAGVLIVTAMTLFFISNCSNNVQYDSSDTASPESFTFFDIGSNSLYSDMLRDNLEKQLGSESIEQKNTIDLSIHTDDFLKKYFPKLEQLNQKLNWPPRERIEHNMTKLMYRFANKKGLPFNYVELFFSNYSGKPVFFRIFADSQGPTMIESLKKKYGSAQKIKWSEKGETTLFWQKQRDILTASTTLNRFDKPEYLYCIYYVNNLENYIKKEEIKQKAKEKKQKQPGKTAF